MCAAFLEVQGQQLTLRDDVEIEPPRPPHGGEKHGLVPL